MTMEAMAAKLSRWYFMLLVDDVGVEVEVFMMIVGGLWMVVWGLVFVGKSEDFVGKREGFENYEHTKWEQS